MERSLQTLEFNPVRIVSEKLLGELADRGLSIAVAEGCSGGSILDSLTIPGSTRSFHVGGVFYSRRSKIDLGVSSTIIDRYGEYSLNTAMEMARSIQKINNDSFGIASVGHIDPDVENYRKIFLGFSSLEGITWSKIITLPTFISRSSAKQIISKVGLENVLFHLHGESSASINKSNFTEVSSSFSPEEEKLKIISQSLVDKLSTNCLTISAMESCTGGSIANAITNTSGASNVFDSGLVTYDEDVKAKFGVPLSVMSHGVYTEEVALEMAKAVMKRTDSDLAIATTGTMNNMDTRPFHNDASPGTVFIAVTYENRRPLVCKLNLQVNTREQMKLEISSLALQLAEQMIEKPEVRLIDPRQWENDLVFIQKN